MYGYYREKFYVNHFWELKGYTEKTNQLIHHKLVIST